MPPRGSARRHRRDSGSAPPAAAGVNLGLVDLTGFPGPKPARAKIEIINDAGISLDSFEVSIPSAGGMQINDLFHGRSLPESTKPVTSP